MKIGIIGWYGMKNVGDDAFQVVFQQQLSQHQVFFCKSVLDLEKKPERVIFGGGGVVTPGTYFHGISHEQKLYAVGVDVATSGPQFENWTKYNFVEMFVRSELYAADLQAAGKPVKYSPDIVFAHPVPECLRSNPNHKRILVNVTDEINKFPSARAELIKALAALSSNCEIHFVSFYNGTPKPDWEVHRALAQEMPVIGARIVHKEDYIDASELMQYISKMDLVLSMRFHAAIFSTMVGVPFVSFSATGKNSLYCQQEGLVEQFLDIEKLSCPLLLSRIAHTISHTNSYRQKLDAIAGTNLQIVNNTFDYIRKTWLA